MRRRVTIRDVAAAAGVSITTVSHSLNDKGTISADTRERVRVVADRLGYQADPLARGMRRSPIGVVGLMLRPLDSLGTYRPGGVDYFTRLSGAVSVECLDHAISVMLIRDLTRLPRSPLSLSLDGYIIDDPLVEDPVIDLLMTLDAPFVTIGRDPARPDFTHWIGSHDADETARVLELFAASGARRIALVTGEDANAWNLDSESTYLSWAATHRMPPQVVRQPEAAGVDGGRAAARELLARDPRPPDAIYCLTGRHARGVLEELTGRGVDVPGQTQLVAGSDAEQARSSNPQITAIDLEPESVATVAVGRLRQLMRGESDLGPPTPLRNRLIERGTTLRGPAAG
ncbi:LacI family DNA-binding transcriptional regulator [Nocardioides sp. SYSU DS0663]|uniref:LacI family DNA-binding transcriptional regulator n=1 Tax=Nocardioides sp. SYSU DS0663 TaxID=3416445 RepID=UPI003F4BCDFC